VSAIRLTVGVIVMGIGVPITLFMLLRLTTFSNLFTIAAVSFISWGVADLLASILERPRLKGRSPRGALRDDLEQRSKE
jgi:hypothetical protein